MLVSGVFILATGLAIGRGMSVLLGLLLSAVGAGFVSRPWFVVFDQKIEIRNMVGMTMKTHEFDSLRELEVVGKRVCRGGSPLKGVGGMLVRSSDLADVASAIEEAKND